MKKLFYIITFIIATMWLLTGTSCSHKTLQSVAWKDSVRISVRTDTVTKTNVVTQKVTEYRDRWNDRFVVVTTAGDTVKDYREKIIYMEKESYLRDSVALYKARLDSLMNTIKHGEQETITKEPPFWMNWRFLACLVAIIFVAFLIARKLWWR